MKNIEVIIGEYFESQCANCPVSPNTNTKTIVFDLDETIGQFSNLQQLNAAFESILRRQMKQEEFNELLDFRLTLNTKIKNLK